MKNVKLLFAMLTLGVLSLNASAGNYRIDEVAIETAFEQAEDVTFKSLETIYAMNSVSTNNSIIKGDGDSKFVFLLATFFCGNFGIHRYYAGAEGMKYCGFYFCTGGIIAKIDFFHVLFNGSEVSDYGAEEFIVW